MAKIHRLVPLAAALALAACVSTPIDPNASGRKDAGDIFLTLQDASGKPLAGKPMRASLATSAYRLATSPVQPPQTSRTANSEEDGLTRFGGLVPGTYVVEGVGTAPRLEKRYTIAGGQRLHVTLKVPAGTVFGQPSSPTPMPQPSASTSPVASPSASASPATSTPSASPSQAPAPGQ